MRLGSTLDGTQKTSPNRAIIARVTKLVLAPSESHVRIRTFAEGLLARLAHDLELVCREPHGAAERTDGDDASGHVDIAIAKIDVNGTLKHGRMDPDGLSASDRADCLAKMRKDVFFVDDRSDAFVRVTATLRGNHAQLRIATPGGAMVERPVTVILETVGEHATRVSGTFDVSLNALGSSPIKGPMNAFRVKDSVEVAFDLLFREAEAER